jgi:hypothetical protein
VLRGHPHRLLLLHGSLLRDARGGGLESPPLGFLECLTRAFGLLGNLCHLILQEAATGRMARGRATLGQGGGGDWACGVRDGPTRGRRWEPARRQGRFDGRRIEGGGPLNDGRLDGADRRWAGEGRWRGKESVDGVNAVGRSGCDRRGKGTVINTNDEHKQ